MFSVDGYKVHRKIKQDGLVGLYEATDVLQCPALIVHLSTENVPPDSITEITNNYDRIRTLRSDNLVRIHDCRKVPVHNREDVVFVCESPRAKAFSECPKPVREDFPFFFNLAIGLAEAANQLHQAGILMKAINPATLLLGNDRGHILIHTPLVLAAASSPISKKAIRELYDDTFIYQVLPFISPEQTGRMNRQVDHRSDFYAFGVLFYELLTGRTPFASNDPLELIHSHIARQPIPPTKIRMDIPEMLSRITLKLLAKMPEDRYQSAFGLLSDLRRCQQEYSTHAFMPSFALGNRDAPERLQISGKLVGREEQVEALSSVFEKVKAGSSEIFLVTGPPGIGKTRLVEELRGAVGEAGGYFGGGKYDPFHRNTPYSAIIGALREIIKKILSEDSERLAYWKKQFQNEIGARIQTIIEFIPELACVVGPQPPPPMGPPDKAKERLLDTCVDFLRGFAHQEHPLVIFLDDLQWIDSASLVLIEHVLTGTSVAYCMFIGAYRDNEVTATHALTALLQRLRGYGIPVGGITLEPLGVDHIRQSLIASLSKNIAETQTLAEMIHLKTHGNPFFAGQFIQSLYLRKLLYFDFQTGVWRWNEQGIRAQAFTDNVLDLMSGDLQNLPKETQAVLKIAACIGNRFDFILIAAINEATIRETAAALLKAIDFGYIVARGDGYHKLNQLVSDDPPADARLIFDQLDYDSGNHFEFLHDRVQQAVYNMLPIQARRPLHLKIGQLLLKQIEEKKRQDNIFNIVNQLNHGVDSIIGTKKRNDFARLYLAAGRKAQEGAAYLLATNYFNGGIALLSDGCWDEDYDLAFGLYKGKLECAFFGRKYDEAEKLFEFVAERTTSVLDKAILLNFRLIMYASEGKYQEAVAAGMHALGLLGQRLSMRPGNRFIKAKFILLRMRLPRRRLGSVAGLPEITDPRKRLIMKLLQDISLPIYITNPEFYIQIVIRIFDLTLRFGGSPAALCGCAVYGGMCAHYEKYEMGSYLGRLVLEAIEKCDRTENSAKVLLFYGAGVSFWKHHVRFGIDCHRRGLACALENGDQNFAMHHIQSMLIFMFTSGAPLEDVEIECRKHFDFVTQSRNQSYAGYMISLRQTIKCLRGETKTGLSLDDDGFSEAAHLKRIVADGVSIVILRHYLLKLQLLYIMGDYEGALEMARASSRLILHHAGTILVTEYYFYRSLAMLAVYAQSPLKKRRVYRKSIRRYVRKFGKMAENCPSNFEHKYSILLGEKAVLEGCFEKAFSCFKKAVDSARENGFLHMAAIGNELSAAAALKQGYESLAKVFIREAHADYLKWGATAKCRLLARRYSQYFRDQAPSATFAGLRQIDYATVVSALQAISTEIELDRLLRRLMKIVVENAGAQRVLFILKNEDHLEIKASSRVGGPIRITHQAMPVQKRDDLLLSGIHFVQHTLTSVVIDDAQVHSDYRNDPYVLQYRPKSIFCLPVLRQSDLVAILYLENNLVAGVFTPDRIEILQLIASQAAISIENAKLYESLRRKERDLIGLSEKLRSLSSELLLTEERERRRIAVDLHDRIGHALANVKMQLGALKENLDEAQNIDRIGSIAQLIDQSIQDTQSLTFDLSPPVLYDLGLEAALEWLVDQMQEQYRISMTFCDDQQIKEVDESIRILAFQAVRELLFNIVKHAHAHHAWVSIQRRGNWIYIEIKDDGVGLHTTMRSGSRTGKKGGFGLFSIQERLKHFGGRLDISSEAGKGTQITLTAPMQIDRRIEHEHAHPGS